MFRWFLIHECAECGLADFTWLTLKTRDHAACRYIQNKHQPSDHNYYDHDNSITDIQQQTDRQTQQQHKGGALTNHIMDLLSQGCLNLLAQRQ